MVKNRLPADTTDIVAIGLIVVVLIAIVEVLVPRVRAIVLRTGPIVVGLEGISSALFQFSEKLTFLRKFF